MAVTTTQMHAGQKEKGSEPLEHLNPSYASTELSAAVFWSSMAPSRNRWLDPHRIVVHAAETYSLAVLENRFIGRQVACRTRKFAL